MESSTNNDHPERGSNSFCGCKTDNVFFTFINPYLTLIDSGQLFRQPIRVLYACIAGLHLLMPVVLIVQLFSIREWFSNMPAKVMIGMVFFFFIALGLAWIGFQLWWDRKDKVPSTPTDDFVTTPIVAHFIQTWGEWMGTLVAVGGFCITLIVMLLGVGDIPGMGVMGVFNYGWLGLVICPLYGFLILVASRCMAEMLKAVVSIANNTKQK